MNMFEDIQKQAAESQKRWEEIGAKAEKLEKILVPGGSIEEATRITAEIVLLLVQQFRPMATLESDDFINDFMKSLMGGTQK